MRQYLVDLRKQKKETQQDVAAALGVSRQYYAMIENGNRQKRMDITLITALSAHFNIPASDIVAFEQRRSSA